jgi:hypothetical protein
MVRLFMDSTFTFATDYAIRGASDEVQLRPGNGFVLAYATPMMTVCRLACLVPTRHALNVLPTQALRADGS